MFFWKLKNNDLQRYILFIQGQLLQKSHVNSLGPKSSYMTTVIVSRVSVKSVDTHCQLVVTRTQFCCTFKWAEKNKQTFTWKKKGQCRVRCWMCWLHDWATLTWTETLVPCIHLIIWSCFVHTTKFLKMGLQWDRRSDIHGWKFQINFRPTDSPEKLNAPVRGWLQELAGFLTLIGTTLKLCETSRE